MRALLVTVAGLMISACSLFSPRWHWEKAGGDYEQDERICKAQAYSGTDGMVTNASVRKMHTCMEYRGWRKVEN